MPTTTTSATGLTTYTFVDNRSKGMVHDVDLILVEGYKNGDLPQIGIARAATGKGFTAPLERFIGLVTDMEVEADIPCFGLENVEAIAAFILEHFPIASV